MALIDLYSVTNALLALLKKNIDENIDPEGTKVTVTSRPPEQLDGEQDTLSLHLYHVSEDAYYKNFPGPDGDNATAPMALSLFYILTAHHGTEANWDAQRQQNLMGYALKTFHDFPILMDTTKINDTAVLDDQAQLGGDNSLHIILRPISPEDALAFWSTEEKRTARLSAYYEVRVVMLEPEKPKTLPGVVLNLGAYLVQIGAPHLRCSRSTVSFQIPAKAGGGAQEIDASPARVTPGHDDLFLLGTNLTIGNSQSLFLRNALWSKLGDADDPIDYCPVPEVGGGWAVSFESDRITVQLATTLDYSGEGGTTSLPVLPGLYGAVVRAVKEEKVVGGEVKQVTVSSNEVGFAVTPRVVSHAVPDGNGNIRVELDTEFDPLDENLEEDAIQVIVGGVVYTREDSVDGPAEFSPGNDPAPFILIKPHFSVPVTEPEAVPFRLVVNGAESAPFWIELAP